MPKLRELKGSDDALGGQAFRPRNRKACRRKPASAAAPGSRGNTMIADIPRRAFLRAAAAAVALPILPHAACALDYPTRPVRLIEGFGGGSTPDVVARLIGQALSERLGQPFVIENRTGSSSNIAADHVARATPDGYTLLLLTVVNAINATMYKLSFDLMLDFVPVASVSQAPLVMEVNPSVPARTLADFLAYAKASPGKINLASAGTGTSTHVAGEMFKRVSCLDLFHVPYRGAQVFPAMLSGEAQVYFGPLISSIGYIRAGNLRALAVTSTTRSSELPDVPALNETFAGFEAMAWQGIAAPRDTPPEVVAKLSAAVNASLADEKFQARVNHIGAAVLAGSPADFAKLIADETKKWGKVVVAANLQLK
jgi:tripartite-type tricarboxylate transporter receptor subunit TctC